MVIWLLSGLLMAALSIPLIHERVPRNWLYGVRTPKTLRSDENWYRANRYGGVLLARAGATISICSLLLLPFASRLRPDVVGYLGLAITLIPITIATVLILRYVNKL